MTQLDLALDAGVSARHLSFVETGRSKPGRNTVLKICAQLDVPFREQNRLLVQAGHAPAFPERAYDDPALEPVRAALDLILSGHEPYPALAVDRHWDLVAANSVMWDLAGEMDIDPGLLEPPLNVLRVGLHPRGLAPALANLGEWRTHFIGRVERQVATTGDERLAALLDEIAAYPAPRDEPAAGGGEILGPLKVRAPDGTVLSFIGMFAIFDTPFEVTASELAVELLFPADEPTATLLRARRGSR